MVFLKFEGDNLVAFGSFVVFNLVENVSALCAAKDISGKSLFLKNKPGSLAEWSELYRWLLTNESTHFKNYYRGKNNG